MSSPFQIHFRSAIANRTKRDTLLQEAIRILRSSGPDANHLERKFILSKFMNSLRISGYDQVYRYHTLRGILNLEQKHEKDNKQGIRIRYRSRIDILIAKQNKIGKFPATWFLRGSNQNTLKVQATPDSNLLQKGY